MAAVFYDGTAELETIIGSLLVKPKPGGIRAFHASGKNAWRCDGEIFLGGTDSCCPAGMLSLADTMTPTAAQSSIRTSITIERLRLEAALRHRSVRLKVHAGKLLLPLETGDLPIAITHAPPNGVRVEIRTHLGKCLEPDAEFLSFVASVNDRRTTPVLEVLTDGTTGLFWRRQFERAIDVDAVLQGLIEVSEAFTEIGTELREHFFVQPVVQPVVEVEPQNQEGGK